MTPARPTPNLRRRPPRHGRLGHRAPAAGPGPRAAAAHHPHPRRAGSHRPGRRAGLHAAEKPGQVFLAAAKVGGIHANNEYPAEFIRDNLAIQTNVIHAAYKNNVKRLLFLGSSCIYPKLAPQPMKEEHLLTGPLNPPTAPTPWPRSPASRCAGATTASTAPNTCSRHAHQPLRPRRQLPPREQPRHPRPDPQVSRSQAKQRPHRHASGAPARPGANSSTAKTWPTPASTS
jgi:hypothetical protein